MNLRELLLIVGLALISTWTIEYLFFKKNVETSDQIKSGQGYVAPKKAQELKPIDTEVDFIDAKRSGMATKTEVDTPLMRVTFSTDGASIDRLEFKKEVNGIQKTIDTIFPLSDTERERRSFLVALAEKTPYFYSLVNHQDDQNQATVEYKAESNDVTIIKKFIVDKQKYKINLQLTIQPKVEVQPRIFFPAPLMPEITDDVKSGFVAGSENSAVTIVARPKINQNMYWFSPTLFGAENRYFAHALVEGSSGAQAFANRAYYKLTGQNELFAIVEGPVISQETTWDIPFYFGPKEEKAMKAVDPRLEQTLEYAGWLAPISKLLLRFLVFLYGYLKNYGFAIIALTIFIKILLLPFSIKGAQSMKQTSEIQRKLQYLQQKYKDEPEILAQERAELIRKHGMPGVAGCLPILLQIPIFIALSRVLSSSIELYKAPFILWIQDLSKPDPYYALPILIGISMLMQSTTMDSKQRLQFVLMALFFGAISVSFSAGLSLYIFMSTFLGVVQTWIQNRFKTNHA